MTERDEQIVKLTIEGMSAAKVKQKLNLPISVRAIQRVAAKHVGASGTNKNGAAYFIPAFFMPLIHTLLAELGLNRYECGICHDLVPKGCIVHHTKYEGVTIFDLMYVCVSCNNSRTNVGLA